MVLENSWKSNVGPFSVKILYALDLSKKITLKQYYYLQKQSLFDAQVSFTDIICFSI